MEDIFITSWEVVYNAFDVFLHSKTFFVIKIFLMIYTAVLIVDIILLMYLGNVRNQLRDMYKGTADIKMTKRADRKKWQEIINRLESQDEKQYRAAVLEADQFVYMALELQGYSGGNFAERVAQIPAGSFTSLDIVHDVHALSKKIVHNNKLRITVDQAKNAIGVYEKFMKELDIL